jgi:hypothetical protein
MGDVVNDNWNISYYALSGVNSVINGLAGDDGVKLGD